MCPQELSDQLIPLALSERDADCARNREQRQIYGLLHDAAKQRTAKLPD